MVLLYRKIDSSLFGYIAFYKIEHSAQGTETTLIRESKPFVIGHYSTKENKIEVYGSVVFLLEEIRRIVAKFIKGNNAWHAERLNLTSETKIRELDYEYDQKVMDFVILVSTHARNLFDLMGRFNDRSIPRLNYNNSPDGVVTLRELFDTLIHNRYYYFDGGHIKDLFSEDFKKKNSALSGRFMGYGFDLFDFVTGISQVIEEVRVKHLTQILWGKFRDFTAESKPQDIVFLVQNMHALSELLKAKIPLKGYEFMTRLIFDDLDEPVEGATSVMLPDGTTLETRKLVMESPQIRIARELNKKELEIYVRRAIGGHDQSLGREDLNDHKVNIGFEDFFREVNKVFGDDRVLSGGSTQFVSASTDSG